jgi:hypothetical protein
MGPGTLVGFGGVGFVWFIQTQFGSYTLGRYGLGWLPGSEHVDIR